MKNRKIAMKFQSLDTRIFISIVFITCSLLLCIMLIIYSIVYNYISSSVRSNQKSVYHQVENLIETEIDSLNSISMNFIYSNLVKNSFSDYLELEQATSVINENINQLKYAKRQAMYDFIIAILGPNNIINQINMYSMDGYCIGSGLTSYSDIIDLNALPWFTEVMDHSGKMVLSQFIPDKSSEPVISLARTFYSPYYELEGIIEIQRSYDLFFKEIINLTKNNPNFDIIITDPSDDILFPLDENMEDDILLFQNAIKQEQLLRNTSNTVSPNKSKAKKLLYWDTLIKTDWNIIIVLDYNELYAPLYQFTYVTIVMLIISLCIALFFSNYIAKNISVPINKLSNELKAVTIDNAGRLTSSIHMQNTNITEINILYKGLYTMNEKIRLSIDELLVAKKHEMDAKTLALHNLMGPHFLFNNLATISALSNDENYLKIPGFCHDLTYLLRYASSDLGNNALLQEELDFTTKYISCMKIKFNHSIPCNITIPKEMLSLELPKMTLQPLIENAFKYGMDSISSFTLEINGSITPEKWMIQIKDNGFGFDPLILDSIKEELFSDRIIDFTKGIQIGGLGISNIYLRLKMLYEDKLIFDIESDECIGTIITIGCFHINAI